MPAERAQLNVRVSQELFERVQAYVAAERERRGDVKGHPYSQSDAVSAALSLFLGGGQPNTLPNGLEAVADRLERVCDDFEHMRNRIEERVNA